MYFDFLTTTTILCSVITSVVLGYFIYFTIQLYFYKLKFKHIPGPPVHGLFGFYTGNLQQIIEADKKGMVLSDILNEWLNTYGTVIKYQLFNKMIVLTIDPIAVRDVLISRNFPKYPLIYKLAGFPFSSRYLGNGLVTEQNYHKWKHQRALFNPGFHRQKLIEYMYDFNAKGDILIERLRTIADGKTTIQLFNEINHATLDVIASIAFGMNVDSINDPNNKLNYYVYESLKGLNHLIMDPLVLLKPSGWVFLKKYNEILRNLRQIGREQILNRIKVVSEDGQITHNDLLANIFKTHENEVFDIEDMTDQFVTFFIAGQETTANALPVLKTFNSTARKAKVGSQFNDKNGLINYKRLREELDAVFGSRTEIKYEDLAELKYTTCVIKETLRLWPPVSAVSREVPDGFKINDQEIPSGCWMQVGPYHSGRCEKFFPNALEFQPERFLKESNEENNQNYTYFPFSLGPRNCIGQNFAQMEAKVLLAKIVKNFDFALDSNQNFGIKLESTIRPIDGCKCILTPREN